MRATFGTILFAGCVLTAGRIAQAQSPVSNALRSIEQYQERNIVAAAEEMPADKYGFKPTPAQMSFGKVVVHLITEGNYELCSAASGQKAPEIGKFEETDSKDKLVAGLKESFKFCQTAFAQLQDAQLADSTPFGRHNATRAFAALITVGDWEDHYSQMSIYLRLNGHLPPTAKKA